MSDPIKESFQKVKEDINSLKQAVNVLSEEIEKQRNTLSELKRTFSSAQNSIQKTDRHINPAHNPAFYALKDSNFPVSTGNNGVPADRQTDQQTDRHIPKFAQLEKKPSLEKIEKVSEVLDSLDGIRKDLRTKVKKLTPQEMLVYTTIYHLTNEGFIVDYSILSEKTNLTESSIRDYVQKILKKGFPVDKIKENNKKVTLQIPENFKRIASLDTLHKLREI